MDRREFIKHIGGAAVATSVVLSACKNNDNEAPIIAKNVIDGQGEMTYRINPNSGLYCEGMGLLHKRNGNYARAAELFTQVIKVQPNVQLLGNRADCYLILKRLNDAEDDIRTALELAPDDPYLYLLRAKLNKLRFQREDMNRDIDTAVTLGLPRDYINTALNE